MKPEKSTLLLAIHRIITLLAATGLILAVTGMRDAVPTAKERWQIRQKNLRIPGPFPSDWFMDQRTWPDRTISAVDYASAYESAERLSRSSSLDDPPPWIPAGPTNIGGRIADIVGHPTNPDVIYVASASGGVFKTMDGGGTWIPIFDNAPVTSMGALAMDTQRPDTVYVGTGEACSAGASYFGTGVYRTEDGGGTWQHLGLEETKFIARIAIHPVNSARVFVAAMGELYITSQERGVYRTTDAGQTWERVLFVNDSTGASDVAINPSNPQIVLAAMWQRIRSPINRISGGRGSGIYRSIDGGTTWERMTDGLPPVGDNVGRIGLAISPSNPSIVYACFADHPGYFLGVFRSIDGGVTWGQVNDEDLSDIYSSFGWYFGDIRVRPDNPNMVFVLGVPVFRSTNGGASWSMISSDMHVDNHAMWFNPGEPFKILEGNDGGVYRSTNNGNTWTFLGGLPVNQFYAASVDYQLPQRRYGGTQDNGTLRTLTGAVNDWDHIHGGDGFYALVDPTNSNRIYAEYQYGALERSEDGGIWFDWIMPQLGENELTNWSTPVVMSPHNPNILYYGAQHIYRTTNRGDSWTAISPDLSDGPPGGNLVFGTITTIAVSSLSADVIYAGTDDANVWVTRNGGQTWNNISEGLPDRWITRVAADPFADSVAYVTVSGFHNAEDDAHVFRSANFGQTWVSIGGNLPASPLNDIVPDPSIRGRLYAASDFGVNVSSDMGRTWIALDENLPRVPVIQLVLHDPSRELTAATYGRSMFTLDLNELQLNHSPEIVTFVPGHLDTVDEGSIIVFAVSAMDPDTDSLSYAWTRNGDTVGTDTSVQLTFSTVDITETIVISVSDGDLSAEHRWQFHVVRPDAAWQVPELAGNHLLLAAYPNPFNPIVNLAYNLPEAGQIELTVFDLTGRKVTTLLSENRTPGQASVQWDARHQSSGTYFAVLRTSSDVRVQKLLLLQ